MFYGASPLIFKRAEILRSKMTIAEDRLWTQINDHQILGLKFRRQHPISQFIVDFYCHKVKLVIEVDGGIHLKRSVKEYDKGRTFELEKFGIQVIRFSNEQVENEISQVIELISNVCSTRLDN